MKPRAASRGELVERLDSQAPVAPEDAPSRRWPATLLALAMLIVVGGVVFYFSVFGGREPVATAKPVGRAALLVESEPMGASISIGGEPTGLKTPATLTALSSTQVVIRLELAGYRIAAEAIDVPQTGTVTKRFTLMRAAN